MGALLAAVFVCGGVIGGLSGVALSREGREFRDFRRDGAFMMNGRFGNDYGGRNELDAPRFPMQRNVQQNATIDARTTAAPTIDATAPVAPTPAAPQQ